MHHFKRKRLNDSVAQLVEHNTFNVGVLGSNPSGITKTTQQVERFEVKPLEKEAFFCLNAVFSLETAFFQPSPSVFLKNFNAG